MGNKGVVTGLDRLTHRRLEDQVRPLVFWRTTMMRSAGFLSLWTPKKGWITINWLPINYSVGETWLSGDAAVRSIR